MAKEPWLGDDEQKAWRSYLLMWKLLESHVARHLHREYGLSASDFEILVNLSEAPTGRMRAFELGEATQWEKSRMSHHLTRMEKRGLIAKIACDARYPEIAITEQGLEAIRACAPAHAALIRELVVETLGTDRMVALGEAGAEVATAVEKHRQTTCPPEVRGEC